MQERNDEMTRQSSFKRLVRSRMAKTGESYTAARAVLLAAKEKHGSQPPPLATSDTSIRERTGRGWEEWFDLLDAQGATGMSHRDIARWVADQLDIEPLVWEAQAVTASYERARGMRAVGQRADGFTITASKTVAAPAGRAFDAIVDESRRREWLPDDELRERTATRPRSARFDWGDGRTRVAVTIDAKGPDRCTVVVEHSRLTDASHAERMKQYWRTPLAALKTLVEEVATDA
jgi:hypothetical protein